MIKAQISGRMVSSGISYVAIASVYSEKTRLQKCMMIMIIIMLMNKSQETIFFFCCNGDGSRPEIDFRYETKARKVMVDFKFDAL